MPDLKKLESLAFRLVDLPSLRKLVVEGLDFEFADKPVNKQNWTDDEKKIVVESKIIAEKNDFFIYYIQTNTDSLKHWKSIAGKIIKEKNGFCLVCSHNPSGFKWVFSSLSKEFSRSFSETRHVPIEIKPSAGVPSNFVEFLGKLKVGGDSTATSIASQVSEAFDTFAVTIHNELTVNIFEALKTLSEGIIGDKSNKLSLSNETLEEIRISIFTLLYRIIFILYAEDRGIFPVEDPTYHEKFSLKWIKEEWLLKSTKLAEYEVQKRLKDLFKLIELGSEAFDYPKFSMRSYYGRLFDREINSKLESWKIPNSHLIKTLELLTRTKDKKGNYFFLDYAALETRHLGAVYEHLLEFHLEIKNKKIAELPNPEERKSSGSYYTPKYIVDYIAENSIEPLIDKIINENPDKQTQIDQILELKILDPAMGSGHFLVGAIEYVAKRLCEIEFGEIAEQAYIERKRDVVRRCIYGVDMNPLAVDLASLSLWLETLSSEKPLSFLSSHLKCGNSLIGSEIESIFGKQTTLFESQGAKNSFKKNIKNFLMFENLEDNTPSAVKIKLEEYSKMQSKGTIYKDLQFLLNCKTAESFGVKLPVLFRDYSTKIGENSLDYYSDEHFQKIDILSKQETFFHWELEFPQIFYDENGNKKTNYGFDIVIGNPPYIRQELISPIKPYLKENFSVYDGVADLYVYFFELITKVLKENGILNYIISNKWMKTDYGKNTRKYLESFFIDELIDFGDTQIFKGATTYPCIIKTHKRKQKNSKIKCVIIENANFGALQNFVRSNQFHFNQSDLKPESWNIINPERRNIYQRISKVCTTLGDYVGDNIHWGVKTGLTEAFVVDEATKDFLIKKDPNSKQIIKPFLAGVEVKKYHIVSLKKFVLFTRRGIDIEEYPAIKAHLLKFKDKLMPKKDKDDKIGRKPGPYKWYEIQDNVAYFKEFEKPKIIFGYTAVGPRFTFDTEGLFLNNSNYIITKADMKLLGILNSKLGWFFVKNTCTHLHGGYSLLWTYLKYIPIIKNNSKNLERLVTYMLTLNKELQNEKQDDKKSEIEKKISKTDQSIEEEVYKLYGITEEEKKIIESI